MKLFLRHIGRDRSGAVALCTEDGTVLPDQASVVLKSEPNEIVTATVVFAVGGDVVLGYPEDERPSDGREME